MFQMLYPKIGLDDTAVQDYKRKNGHYLGRIQLKTEHVINAIQHYGLFGIHLNREFQLLDKRVGGCKPKPSFKK